MPSAHLLAGRTHAELLPWAPPPGPARTHGRGGPRGVAQRTREHVDQATAAAQLHRRMAVAETRDGNGTVSERVISRTNKSQHAGLLIGRQQGSTLTIDLDYVLSPYRDSRLGRWLYGPGADVFRTDGIDLLRSAGVTDVHRKYLERVGFDPTSDDPDLYELAL